MGKKFEGEDEDAEWEFPRASSIEWVEVPTQEVVEKQFKPKAAHLPIGNTKSYDNKSLLNVSNKQTSVYAQMAVDPMVRIYKVYKRKKTTERKV